MGTPTPTEHETAKVVIWQPGNGTRYKIVYGTDFVALPDFNAAATCSPFPAEHGYLKDKLGLRNDEDARQVFEALRAEQAEPAVRPTEDPEDPHSRFEMYTPEGNAAVAAMVQTVITIAEGGKLPKAIKNLLREGIGVIAATHPEVYDGEPRWAIVDAMNEWLPAHGFQSIDQDDLL